MNLIEEINQLNTKDPGSWPLVIKASALVILLVAIVTAGYFLDWQEQWEFLDQAKAEEVKLKKRKMRLIWISYDSN